ncbi:MAG: hypothetical protein Q8M26_01295 [Pseudolabrys sp.]|nr:hypothetical protein [Pseudolabrys sp.]
MTTLPMQTSHAPSAWSVPSVSRVLAFIAAAFEVMEEAQELSREAHKRYPFVAW